MKSYWICDSYSPAYNLLLNLHLTYVYFFGFVLNVKVVDIIFFFGRMHSTDRRRNPMAAPMLKLGPVSWGCWLLSKRTVWQLIPWRLPKCSTACQGMSSGGWHITMPRHACHPASLPTGIATRQPQKTGTIPSCIDTQTFPSRHRKECP